MLPGLLSIIGFLAASGSGARAPVCIAGAWLPLQHGEHARRWIGPDNFGYEITRRDGKTWELGAGGFGTPLGFKGEGLGRPVVKLPGHVVHEVDGVNLPHRKGYLLLKTRSVTNGETETVVDFDSVYVGGSAVTGGASDRSFFHRFVFGARAKAVCGGSKAQ